MPERREARSRAHDEANAPVRVRPRSGPPAPLPPTPFPACEPPDVRKPPQFTLVYRHPIRLSNIATFNSGNPTQATVACTALTDCVVDMGLDPRFEQTWNLVEVGIGDLASTMGLAPAEQLSLEFQSTQRKVLDQSSMDSAESVDSSESLASDKESINVTRSSTKTENWHVDGSGTLTVGFATLNANAGYSQSVTDSNQQAINHVTEATTKSSRSLKSLHKIEVRGVSEGVITNRMTRVIKNPYFDRTLSVNVFQLVKHFSVQTSLAETRAALVIRVNGLIFDNNFVVSNSDFLQNALLDASLIDDLPTAVQGAKPLFLQDAQGTAASIARTALHLLFDDDRTPPLNFVMFNMPPISGTDAESITNCFNAALIPGNFGLSGLSDSLSNHLGMIFAILSFYYQMYIANSLAGGIRVVDQDPDLAIRMAVTLAHDVGGIWNAMYPDFTKAPADSDIKNIMDENQFTEIFRRIPGFLTTVNGMLAPLLDPANQDKADLQAQAKAMYVLNRLLSHLKCNKNYYIQEYLRYVAGNTSNQAIIDFVNQILADPAVQPQLAPITIFQPDVDRCFINTQEIIVPGLEPLAPNDLVTLGNQLGLPGVGPVADPNAVTADIEVPCDGIHLEVAKGACVLEDVPCPPASLTLSLQGLNASFTGDCGGHGDNKKGSDKRAGRRA